MTDKEKEFNRVLKQVPPSDSQYYFLEIASYGDAWGVYTIYENKIVKFKADRRYSIVATTEEPVNETLLYSDVRGGFVQVTQIAKIHELKDKVLIKANPIRRDK